MSERKDSAKSFNSVRQESQEVREAEVALLLTDLMGQGLLAVRKAAGDTTPDADRRAVHRLTGILCHVADVGELDPFNPDRQSAGTQISQGPQKRFLSAPEDALQLPAAASADRTLIASSEQRLLPQVASAGRLLLPAASVGRPVDIAPEAVTEQKDAEVSHETLQAAAQRRRIGGIGRTRDRRRMGTSTVRLRPLEPATVVTRPADVIDTPTDVLPPVTLPTDPPTDFKPSVGRYRSLTDLTEAVPNQGIIGPLPPKPKQE